jgi:hypothetical protein
LLRVLSRLREAARQDRSLGRNGAHLYARALAHGMTVVAKVCVGRRRWDAETSHPPSEEPGAGLAAEALDGSQKRRSPGLLSAREALPAVINMMAYLYYDFAKHRAFVFECGDLVSGDGVQALAKKHDESSGLVMREPNRLFMTGGLQQNTLLTNLTHPKTEF